MASGKGMLKGCAIGCGLMIALVVVGSIGGGIALFKPFKEAIHTREALDETFGVQADYRPPADGVLAAARIEAFLEVRVELMEHCVDFNETFAQFGRMDDLDDEDVPKSTVFKEVVKTVGKAFGLAGNIGRFAVARNEALTRHEMGLGEYTYIYALAYYAWFGKEQLDLDDDGVKIDTEDASPRVRRSLRIMLRHQLEDLEASDLPDRDVMITELQTELATLNDDHGRFPWQDGPPDRVAAALEPYRDMLEDVYCVGTSMFEMAVTRHGKGGLSISSD